MSTTLSIHFTGPELAFLLIICNFKNVFTDVFKFYRYYPFITKNILISFKFWYLFFNFNIETITHISGNSQERNIVL